MQMWLNQLKDEWRVPNLLIKQCLICYPLGWSSVTHSNEEREDRVGCSEGRITKERLLMDLH